MGRPAGSKNKRPSGISIRNRLAAKGIDLSEKLLKVADAAFAAGDFTNANKALDTLCKYSQVVPTAEPEAEETENPALALSPEELREALS
jgi:hypothetical protein